MKLSAKRVYNIPSYPSSKDPVPVACVLTATTLNYVSAERRDVSEDDPYLSSNSTDFSLDYENEMYEVELCYRRITPVLQLMQSKARVRWFGMYLQFRYSWRSLKPHRWYHSSCDSKRATELLKANRVHGAFLIRKRDNPSQPFALSYWYAYAPRGVGYCQRNASLGLVYHQAGARGREACDRSFRRRSVLSES
jgi:hypothetical protein